jgi:hypothetical protein
MTYRKLYSFSSFTGEPKLMRTFVKVHIDEAKEPGLVQQYGVNGYPAFLVLTKWGRKKLRLYDQPEKFIDQCIKAGLE